jgi:hypothetical protein
MPRARKARWSSRIPDDDGWYWVGYRGKHGLVTCPAEVVHVAGLGVSIRSARNDCWNEGLWRQDTRRGARFGPAIPAPE